jgi:hypothetical protein
LPLPHLERWTSDDREGKKAVEREAIVIDCMAPLNPDNGGPVANGGGELIAVTSGGTDAPSAM